MKQVQEEDIRGFIYWVLQTITECTGAFLTIETC